MEESDLVVRAVSLADEMMRTALAETTATERRRARRLGRLLDDWLAQIPNGAHPGRWLEDKIHKYVAAVPKVREARARRAAELLPNACRLLTHCNVSGEVVAVALKRGLDPNRDIEWRQYPADLLGVALQKGEVQAITLGDPLGWIVRANHA